MPFFSRTSRKPDAPSHVLPAKQAPPSHRAAPVRRTSSHERNQMTPLKHATLGRANSLTALPWAARKPAAPEPSCRFVATAEKLGSGAYGAVLLGRDAATADPVAIKFIPEGRMRQSSLEREVAMLRRLSEANHPALVRFYAHVRPAEAKAAIRAEGVLPLTKGYEHCHALVMEAARGGELFDHVVAADGLTEAAAAPLFAQLVDSVRAAHDFGIAHRDLKLENVLLLARVGAKGAAVGDQRIKLIDWGLAHQHALTSDGAIVAEKLHSRCGSRSYMAPEVTNRDISGTIGYDGFAADVWSLGVCLFAMHLAFFPFEQAHPENDWRAGRVVEAQSRGESTVATILSFYPQKPFRLSPSLVALLDRMLIFDPRRRASLFEVLHSEWLMPHVAKLRVGLVAKLPNISVGSTRSGRSASDSSTVSTASYTSSASCLSPVDEPPSELPHRADAAQRQDSTASTQTAASDYSSASRAPVSRPPSPLRDGGAPCGLQGEAALIEPPEPYEPEYRINQPCSPRSARAHAAPRAADYRAAPVYRGAYGGGYDHGYEAAGRPATPTVEIVIAGGRSQGAAMAAQQSLKYKSSIASSREDLHEISDGRLHEISDGCSRSAYLASFLSKSCKVSRCSSPRSSPRRPAALAEQH